MIVNTSIDVYRLSEFTIYTHGWVYPRTDIPWYPPQAIDGPLMVTVEGILAYAEAFPFRLKFLATE